MVDSFTNIDIRLQGGKVTTAVTVTQRLGITIQTLKDLLLERLEGDRDGYPHRRNVVLVGHFQLDKLVRARAANRRCRERGRGSQTGGTAHRPRVVIVATIAAWSLLRFAVGKDGSCRYRGGLTGSR